MSAIPIFKDLTVHCRKKRRNEAINIVKVAWQKKGIIEADGGREHLSQTDSKGSMLKKTENELTLKEVTMEHALQIPYVFTRVLLMKKMV
jgi:hypothetical protein